MQYDKENDNDSVQYLKKVNVDSCPFDGMNDEDSDGICRLSSLPRYSKFYELSWYMWNVWFWSCE